MESIVGFLFPAQAYPAPMQSGINIWIIIAAVLIIWIILKHVVMDPPFVQKMCVGKTPEQKEIVRYFYVGGCLRKRLSDAEYDAIVARSVINLRQKALDAIGLDEDEVKEIDPVHFEWYRFDNDSFFKRGDDGKWRSSKYQVSWLFFTDTHVHVYTKTTYFDVKKEYENTLEYCYRDITAFSTISETKDVTNTDHNGKEYKQQVDITQFKLVVPGDSFECPMLRNEYTENAVQGMKAKLREMKREAK